MTERIYLADESRTDRLRVREAYRLARENGYDRGYAREYIGGLL